MRDINYIHTDRKTFTIDEALDQYQRIVSPGNFKILIDHICIRDLAEMIDGFSILKGVVFFDIDGKMTSVQINKNKSE